MHKIHKINTAATSMQNSENTKYWNYTVKFSAQTKGERALIFENAVLLRGFKAIKIKMGNRNLKKFKKLRDKNRKILINKLYSRMKLN